MEAIVKAQLAKGFNITYERLVHLMGRRAKQDERWFCAIFNKEAVCDSPRILRQTIYVDLYSFYFTL